MDAPINRRQFLARSSATAATILLGKNSFGAVSPNEKLNIGVIGTANRAGADLRYVSTENIVALCDVDERLLDEVRQNYPRAAVYQDFRKMLERNDLDAVVIGTPDHTHAVAAVAAMESGRHVYCEKPLAHTISETRRMAEIAKKYNRVTQMGTQIHATNNYHEVAEALQRGVIGPVREVHVWVGAIYTANEMPADKPPVPKNLDWDLWLGPAHERPYSPAYVPKQWRRYWAFGGGTLADMGCHYIDLAHWSLGLRYPLSVETEGPPVNAEGTPPWLIARYEYPARGENPPVKLTWYHGSRDGKEVRPPQFARGELPEWGNGILFIGDKGMLLAEYSKYVLLPEKDFPPRTIEAVHQPDDHEKKHHQQWINAIKTGGTTACNFDYSGALTEAVLLGNVAYRCGEKIIWNPAKLVAVTHNRKAEKFIQHHYRRGWKI